MVFPLALYPYDPLTTGLYTAKVFGVSGRVAESRVETDCWTQKGIASLAALARNDSFLGGEWRPAAWMNSQ